MDETRVDDEDLDEEEEEEPEEDVDLSDVNFIESVRDEDQIARGMVNAAGWKTWGPWGHLAKKGQVLWFAESIMCCGQVVWGVGLGRSPRHLG